MGCGCGCGCGTRNKAAAKTTGPVATGDLFEVVNTSKQIVLRTRDEGAAKTRVRGLRDGGGTAAHHRRAGTTAALPL